MSPLSLRRYRAERLLRHEFEALQGRVLAAAARRLRASGVRLDGCDLEACYAAAWQGLYMAVLDGQEIASPAGWLVLVTFRRGIEEHRARVRADRSVERVAPGGRLPGPTAAAPEQAPARERDLAAELDDRARLRQLFEGLRGRLSEREREAAVLCYLQGLSRAQAAARMGVSEARMRKLMEGRGPERPGVAGKVGALVQIIRDGGWCEEQGSLMRGLAFGILDPDGERYRLALMHRGECPACRAYVLSLRGLAAALPPVLLPWSLGAGALARVGEGAHAGAAAAGSGAAAAAGAGGGSAGGAGAGAAAQLGPGIGGTLSASGAAGGAAGGSWLLAGGSVGAKLAVGCLLAVSVGAGCVALSGGEGHARPPAHRHRAALARGNSVSAHAASGASQLSDVGAGVPATALAGVSAASAVAGPLTPASRASREFGPEQGSATGAPQASVSSSAPHTLARAASSGGEQATVAGSAAAASSSAGAAPAPSGSRSGTGASVGEASPAAREFSPG